MSKAILAVALALAAGVCFADTPLCLDCHDSADGGSIHALLQTGHGKLSQACEACHGPSTEHSSRPTIASPGVSYGPRWTSNTAEQDGSCLTCHKINAGKHWNESLHMANNVTCVSCHKSHDAEQNLAAGNQQLQTCTVCHKTQKTGMHGRERMVRMNPPCTQCHNPHADQRPVGVMLANDSQGCRRCHNLASMDKSEKISARAKSFHRVMATGERTCVDCHKGVAHGDLSGVESFLPKPRTEGDITLFFPGKSDADWLITEHAGSQPLRQGTNCRQCHRGEEAAMGAALGGPLGAARPVKVSFGIESGELVTRLAWEGDREDTSISLMWSFGGYTPFQRGGCWAACHSDLSGMSQDRGAGAEKYLWSSRAQQRRVGMQAVVKTAAELEDTMARGDFVELWRLDLERGTARVATLLADIQWREETALGVTTSYADGHWSTEIRRPLSPVEPLMAFDSTRRHTFGIALHSKANRGARHWVSLPMTLGVDKDDTDFIVQ